MDRLDKHCHRLLIVDDDASAIQALGRILAGLGEIRFALSGREGLQLAAEFQPDLLLLDAELPDMSGLDLCHTLRSDPQLAEMPVIFVTGHVDLDTELKALEAGANDFIRKPLRPPVVLARARTQLRRKQLTDALRRQAARDGLTGVANRAAFDAALLAEWVRARRVNGALSLVLVDVDHFKRFNDRYGHPAGDACLRAVSAALSGVSQRAADLVARYGGEEFAVLLPGTDATGAAHLAEAARAAVQAQALLHADSPVAACVTVSVGVATAYPARGALAQAGCVALLSAADRALYAAKRAGRNRWVQAGVDGPEPAAPLN